MRRSCPRTLLVPPVLALLASCGGPKRIADITPPLVERTSGTWVLNPDESDDPLSALRAAGMEEGGWPTRGGRRGAGPGGGTAPGGGTMPPGGMRPGSGGMRGGSIMRGSPPDPRAIEAMRRIATTTPTRIGLALTDSLVTVTWAGEGEPFVLPFGDEIVRELGDDQKLEVRASWEDGRLRVRRSVPGAGHVTETFMPSADGKRLTVDVVLAVGPRGETGLKRVYDRPPRATP